MRLVDSKAIKWKQLGVIWKDLSYYSRDSPTLLVTGGDIASLTTKSNKNLEFCLVWQWMRI